MLVWAASQASVSLSLASAAWMVSGLTPSPLINSLLPTLAALPALLPLVRRALLGTWLQLLAVLLLLLVAVATGPFGSLTGGAAPWLLPLSLAGVLLVGLGGQMAGLPLQRHLVAARGVPMARLRRGGDLGALAGFVLTGVTFPIGQALLQFSQAAVLLLPVLNLAHRANPSATRPPAATLPLGWICLVQGLLFGGLFSLLPLWVRQIEGGTCLGFGLVLAAYAVGRSLGAGRSPTGGSAERSRPRLAAARYLLLALLLVSSRWLPGWSALLPFVPIGILAATSDAALVAARIPMGTHGRSAAQPGSPRLRPRSSARRR